MMQRLDANVFEQQALQTAEAYRAWVSQLPDTSVPVGYRILKTPGVSGGDACINRTRIPVWLIVSYVNEGCSVEGVLEDYPTLTAEDVYAALSYYSKYPEEIHDNLREQDGV